MKKYEICYIIPLRKKCPYSELFSPNTGKYRITPKMDTFRAVYINPII